MPPEDRIRLRHIIDAGEIVASFIAGRARADLDRDRMLVFALVRAIEIMGEAASRMSAEARSAAPTVPWAPMIAAWATPISTSIWIFSGERPRRRCHRSFGC